jgi:hypothetical protein
MVTSEFPVTNLITGRHQLRRWLGCGCQSRATSCPVYQNFPSGTGDSPRFQVGSTTRQSAGRRCAKKDDRRGF